MKLLNLDELVSEEKEVTVAGRKYYLPGDIPMKIMLKMLKHSQELQAKPDDEEALSNSMETLKELFSIKQDFRLEVLKDISTKQYLKLIAFICSVDEENIDEKKS